MTRNRISRFCPDCGHSVRGTYCAVMEHFEHGPHDDPASTYTARETARVLAESPILKSDAELDAVEEWLE